MGKFMLDRKEFLVKHCEDEFILVGCIVNHQEFSFPVRFYVGWGEGEKESHNLLEESTNLVAPCSFSLSLG